MFALARFELSGDCSEQEMKEAFLRFAKWSHQSPWSWNGIQIKLVGTEFEPEQKEIQAEKECIVCGCHIQNNECNICDDCGLVGSFGVESNY